MASIIETDVLFPEESERVQVELNQTRPDVDLHDDNDQVYCHSVAGKTGGNKGGCWPR